ncbi:VanZ family protein [Marinactinospora thermotolerans]|uniref:Glycopeptide antibiotics resistance protein n=1 Tax=Marinactinospora thermotolerans DSM 45154 TaxID=1122192 RepID=A0A1T4SB29_9ACTN|nr:VanZ family protein [Marinactinospora thermotolerans]SKA25520.1 Glycopeptide antibiotics resistance protein [Marinactinospora thermotolerans DSM 45154]
MWQVLLYTTPLTVGITLAVLAVAAVVVARLLRNNPGTFPREAKWILAAATPVYLLILAAPILSWDQIGEGDREIIWNPVAYYKADNAPTEGVSISYPADRSQTVSLRVIPVSPERLEEVQAEIEREGEDYYLAADYHRYPLTTGEVAYFDAEGEELAPDVAAQLDELYEEHAAGVDDNVAPSLLVQEKTVNTLLFIPIGIVAFAAFSSWAARLAFGPGLSFTIEFLQWAMAATRSSELADFVVNSAGHLIGLAMAVAAFRFAARSRRRSHHHQDPAKTPEHLTV